jgi:hypothetical protein
MPFKSMIAYWWLRENPGFKTLEKGGEWLEGFCSRLEKKDLHTLDWDHLEELVVWHEEKQDVEHADQFVEGSSSSSIQTSTSVGLPTLGLIERGYLHSKNG